MKNEDILKAVREGYTEIAKEVESCCASTSSCCGKISQAADLSRKIGYSDEEIDSVPDGANLGLGCGNPVALASLKEGEIVLDLGSGAGFDAFLAANKVGRSGKVIGVDMTPEMITKAMANGVKSGYENVEFRLGGIEDLPATDKSVDVIISNCVINLSPDKRSVFREAYRVLNSGGRLIVSDIVLLEELPDYIRESIPAYISCISGAMMKNDYLTSIKQAGFQEVKIMDETRFPINSITTDPTARAIIEKFALFDEDISNFSDSIISIKVHAVKP